MKLANAQSGKFGGYPQKHPQVAFSSENFPFEIQKRINRSPLALSLSDHVDYISNLWHTLEHVQISCKLPFWCCFFLPGVSTSHKFSSRRQFKKFICPQPSPLSHSKQTQTIKVKDLFSSRVLLLGTITKERITKPEKVFLFLFLLNEMFLVLLQCSPP